VFIFVRWDGSECRKPIKSDESPGSARIERARKLSVRGQVVYQLQVLVNLSEVHISYSANAQVRFHAFLDYFCNVSLRMDMSMEFAGPSPQTH
jgi:hypothetical protein